MQLIKKTGSLFFLFILFYNLCGYFIAFSIQQSDIKGFAEKIITGHNPANLMQLVIPLADNNQITWDGDDEMIYQGNRYDVESQKEVSGNLILSCYHDSKEELLFGSLNEHVKNNTDSSTPDKNSQKSKIKCFAPEFLGKQYDNHHTAFSSISAIHIHDDVAFPFSLIEFPTPPPQV